MRISDFLWRSSKQINKKSWLECKSLLRLGLSLGNDGIGNEENLHECGQKLPVEMKREGQNKIKEMKW